MKVWTCVVTDSEGFVGDSVWASAEAAQQDLGRYAAEMIAEDGELDTDVPIRWERSSDGSWVGYFEYSDETYTLTEQEVQGGAVEREAARVEADLRTLAVEEVRSRLQVGQRYHFHYNRVINKPDALHEFDATVRGFDGEYVLVEMADRTATGRSNERLIARRIAQVDDPVIAAFDLAIANDTTTTAEWRDRLASYRGEGR